MRRSLFVRSCSISRIFLPQSGPGYPLVTYAVKLHTRLLPEVLAIDDWQLRLWTEGGNGLLPTIRSSVPAISIPSVTLVCRAIAPQDSSLGSATLLPGAHPNSHSIGYLDGRSRTPDASGKWSWPA